MFSAADFFTVKNKVTYPEKRFIDLYSAKCYNYRKDNRKDAL